MPTAICVWVSLLVQSTLFFLDGILFRYYERGEMYYLLRYVDGGRGIYPLPSSNWYEEHAPGEREKWATSGIRFDWPQGHPLISKIYSGKLYDWLGYRSAPMVRERVKKRLDQMLTDEKVQWIGPFTQGRENYYLMNILTVVDCTSPESTFDYHHLKKETLEGVSICRIKQFPFRVLISEDFWWKIVEEEETGVYVEWMEEDGRVRWLRNEFMKDREKLLSILPSDHKPVFEKKAMDVEGVLKKGDARQGVMLLKQGSVPAKREKEVIKMISREGGVDDAYTVLHDYPEAAAPFEKKLMGIIVKEGSAEDAYETLKNISAAATFAKKLIKIILKEGCDWDACHVLQDCPELAKPYLKELMKKVMSERDGEVAYQVLHDCASAEPYADELIDVMLDKEGNGTMALDFYVYSDLQKYAPLLIKHVLRRGDGSDAYYMLKDYAEAWPYREELMKVMMERGEGYEATDLWKDVPAIRSYADTLIPFILEQRGAYELHELLKGMEEWPEAVPYKEEIENALVEACDPEFAERIRKESPHLEYLVERIIRMGEGVIE